MPAPVNEWLRKARGDFLSAEHLLSVADDTVYDSIVWHSQQSIEKLLKAALIYTGIRPPKIHDLVKLSELLTQVEPKWIHLEADLRKLNKGASEFRYPGDSADNEEAMESFAICSRLRDLLLQILTSDE